MMAKKKDKPAKGEKAAKKASTKPKRSAVKSAETLADAPVPADRATLSLSPELSARLKATGRDWQVRAESVLALWLDEASLALRKDGLQGLTSTVKGKADTARAAAMDAKQGARSGKLDSNLEAVVRTVASTIGKEVAQAAIGAAFAALGTGKSDTNRNRAGAAPAEPKVAPGNAGGAATDGGDEAATTSRPAAKRRAAKRRAAKTAPAKRAGTARKTGAASKPGTASAGSSAETERASRRKAQKKPAAAKRSTRRSAAKTPPGAESDS